MSFPFSLCLITDRALAAPRNLIEIVLASVAGGAGLVQLREKAATTHDFLALARELKAALAPTGAKLVINDRVDIALAAGADGVHLGQDDMPIADAKALLGETAIIGLSASTPEHVTAPETALATYLGVGPIYAQTTKVDAKAPLGIGGFAALRAQAKRPVLAIGGLSPHNAAPVLKAGADGLAVVSAFMRAENPLQTARDFCALFQAEK